MSHISILIRRAVVALLLAPVLIHAQSRWSPPPDSWPAVAVSPLSALPSLLPVPRHAHSLVVSTNRLVSTSDPTPAGQTLAGAGQDESRWRPALVASAGLAVTGALVAYWSTGEADAAYDRYLHAAGAHRQQEALDKTERHDRIAGAAFLLMEAGLVLTARFVFF
jgi:hypothetical protein